MDNELLVKSIKDLCQKNNIAVSQLEKELDFSASLISRWNKTSPSLDKIVEIADYFHVSLDEVVGYKNKINDEFLNLLIEKTINNEVIWKSYNHKSENVPKEHIESPLAINDFSQSEDYFNYIDERRELSYYVIINNSYISIYSEYFADKITNPSDIKLFIQPNDDAKLVEQTYSKQQLLSLWLKILYSLQDEAPDEIKAEDFKNSFINESKNKNKQIFISYAHNKPKEVEEQAQFIIEQIQKPDTQNFFQYISSEQGQQMIKQLGKLQPQDILYSRILPEEKDSKKNEFEIFGNDFIEAYKIKPTKKKKSSAMEGQHKLFDDEDFDE